MIKTKDLQFVYKTTDEHGTEHINNVLNGITLDMPRGSFVSVIGSNGSGKSTLAKHFNALLLPTNGKCFVAGIDTTDTDKIFTIRRSCGMIFQNPDNQLVASIVEDDVAFAPENLCVTTEEIRNIVDASLDAVGMLKKSRHSPGQLSGGQKQRIAIAGILAMQPDCIIFDESTSMLDPIGRRDVLKIAHDLNKEGITIIWITHFMDEAADSERVIVLNQGTVLLDGTPRDIFVDYEALHKIGLESTEAGEIAHKLNKRGFEINNSVLYGDELVDALSCKLQVASKPPSNNAPCQRAGTQHSTSAITLKNVSYSYDAPTKKKKKHKKEYHTILNDISLDIPKGKITSIIGHTGSGKSTLVQLFNALLFPTEGEVYIDGISTTDPNIKLSDIHKKIGLVFQYPECQLFEETCLKDIMFGPKNLGMSDAAAREVALRVAHELNIKDSSLIKSPFDISGGQKRLVAIAGVLAMQSEILILDEPLAGLDPKGRRNITRVISALKESNPDLTIVTVSHSMEHVASFADQIIVLNEGSIFAQGSAEEIFANQEELNKIGLDIPFATKISLKLKQYGIKPCFSEKDLLDEITKINYDK